MTDDKIKAVAEKNQMTKDKAYRSIEEIEQEFLPEYYRRKQEENLTPEELGRKLAQEVIDKIEKRIR